MCVLCNMVSLRAAAAGVVLLLSCRQSVGSFYSFVVKDLDEQDVALSRYEGQVSLVVNVASECGYTDGHYRGLVALQEALESTGFVVLAFPCNQFWAQEPGPPDAIRRTLQRYDVNFPVFGKIDVIGPNAHPAFSYLAEQSGKAPDWNFWKYLVDVDGRVLKAWPPRYAVESIFDDVSRLIQKRGGSDPIAHTSPDEL